MKANAEIVREACHVVWTEGKVDRVPEFYAENVFAGYAFTDWGRVSRVLKPLPQVCVLDCPTIARR
jgi:hypothetical protein